MRSARGCLRVALLWIASPTIPVAPAAGPAEVTIRSAPYVPPATLSAQSNLVESAVTVHDRQGHPAGGFTAADFTLTDNGKPQTITAFSELRRSGAQAKAGGLPAAASPSSEAPQARYVALFFDDLHLAGSGLIRSREAARKLIAAGLPPGERMGVFTDSGTVTVDFTSDTSALLAGVGGIKTHADPADRGMTVCPVLTPLTAAIIVENFDPELFRAKVEEAIACDCQSHSRECVESEEGKVYTLAQSVWENSRHRSITALDVLKLLIAHLGKQNGNRVLLLVSGGFIDDTLMKPEKSAIIEAALRDRVAINSLSTEGILPGTSKLMLLNAMGEASTGTGGRLVENTNDLDTALRGLATPPEVSYLIGFQAADPDGKYHALKVALAGRTGFQVESRPGYLAALPAKAGAKPAAQQRIDRAFLSHDALDGLPASLRVSPKAQADGRYTLKVVVDIDARGIRFAKQGALHLQQLTFVTAIEDGQGNFLTGKQAVMDLRVGSATLAGMQASGIHAVSSFALPKGGYKVREVVRELVQDRLAALETAVDLR
jgi:VWFA-related protein